MKTAAKIFQIRNSPSVMASATRQLWRNAAIWVLLVLLIFSSPSPSLCTSASSPRTFPPRRHLHLHFDGSSFAGGQSAGALIHYSENATWNALDPSVRLVWSGSFFYAGKTLESSLDAEYAGLVEGLYALHHHRLAIQKFVDVDDGQSISVHGDSEIALQHLLRGLKDKRRQSTRDLHRLAQSLLDGLSAPRPRKEYDGCGFSLNRVSRENNSQADALAAEARYAQKSVVVHHWLGSQPEGGYGSLLSVEMQWPPLASKVSPQANLSLRSQYSALRLTVKCRSFCATLALGDSPVTPPGRRQRRRLLASKTFPGDAQCCNDAWVVDLGFLPENPSRPDSVCVDLELRDVTRPDFLRLAHIILDISLDVDTLKLVPLEIDLETLALGRFAPLPVVLRLLPVESTTARELPAALREELRRAQARRARGTAMDFKSTQYN